MGSTFPLEIKMKKLSKLLDEVLKIVCTQCYRDGHIFAHLYLLLVHYRPTQAEVDLFRGYKVYLSLSSLGL